MGCGTSKTSVRAGGIHINGQYQYIGLQRWAKVNQEVAMDWSVGPIVSVGIAGELGGGGVRPSSSCLQPPRSHLHTLFLSS